MLRFADMDDLEAIERIEKICFRERRFRREFLTWILKNSESRTIVWEDEGHPVGSVMILLEADRARVLSIAVLPGYRRRGIGGALLEAAERAARQHGARVARLEVSTKNESAIALYRRSGYRTEGILPRYYSWGDDALSMEKPLNANA